MDRHAAGLQRAKLDKTPLDLLKDATGLELAELLALGFACWAMTTHDRVNGPVRINPFTLVKLPRETVERFLALFATTLEELASELAACALPWQMLPLQTRPLLRIGDEVVVLDEPFLLEAVTTGLYWRVSDHVRKGDPEAWRPWSVAYAEMVEALAEELIKALAPVLLDGSSAFFTEEDIKAAFATKKETPPNIDAGVDFGMGVTLFEIVNKHMSLQARSGDMAAFKTDVDQAVITKAGQLDGTAALLRRDPQPPASPLNKPAGTVFPIVVCGNHFPVNPITRNYVEDSSGARACCRHPASKPLAVIDLDELESCASLAKAGVLLPELLAGWLADVSYRKGSLTLYLWATYGGIQAGAACSRRGQPARGDGRDPAPAGHQARRRPPGLSLPRRHPLQPMTPHPRARRAHGPREVSPQVHRRSVATRIREPLARVRTRIPQYRSVMPTGGNYGPYLPPKPTPGPRPGSEDIGCAARIQDRP